MRLIDADVLMSHQRKAVMFYWSGEAQENVVTVSEIEKAPTIEAEPVKHGRWHDCYQIDEFHYIRICSECANRNVFHKYDSVGDYCPNCGAKMDGGKADAG